MARLTELLQPAGEGVSPEALSAGEERIGRRLPEDVREFLLESDGSAWTDFPECGIQVLRLADIVEVWELPEGHRSGPRRLVDVASDGSRERFCFDPRTQSIVQLDIVGDTPPVAVASSLTELVEKLAAGWDPFSAVLAAEAERKSRARRLPGRLRRRP